MSDFFLAVYHPVRAFLDGGNPYDSVEYLARYPATHAFAPYLPGTFLLHLPFGFLSPSVAAISYLAATLVLTLLLAALSLRLNDVKTGAAGVFLLAGLILISRPGRMTLLLGQVTLQIVLACYLALYCAPRAPRASGAWLTLALLKPTYGLPLTALMLARGNRRAVAYGVLFSVVVNVPITLVLIHRAHGVRRFASGLMQTATGFQALSPVNSQVFSQYRVDANALLARISGQPLSGASQVALALVVIGLASLVLHRTRQRLPYAHSFPFAAALTVPAVLLSLYHQPPDLIFLTLPFVATVFRRLPPELESPGLRWTLLIAFNVLAWNYLASDSALQRFGFVTMYGRDLALNGRAGGIALASLNALALVVVFCVLIGGTIALPAASVRPTGRSTDRGQSGHREEAKLRVAQLSEQ